MSNMPTRLRRRLKYVDPKKKRSKKEPMSWFHKRLSRNQSSAGRKIKIKVHAIRTTYNIFTQEYRSKLIIKDATKIVYY